MTQLERHDTQERLLSAAHRVIGQRIDERPEDPGWSLELAEEDLVKAAVLFVEARGWECH